MVEDTISRSSICILQDRPFNGRLKAHKGAIHKLDNLEGRDYVPDCVKILLKAEQMIPSTGYTDTTHMHRTITADEEFLELTMPIYVYDDGNGADDYPLTHPNNMGFELLEEVTFEVPVAPIRNKLKRLVIGTSIASNQSSQVAPQSSQMARRSSRPKKGNPLLGVPPPPPYTPVGSSGQPPAPRTLLPEDQCGTSVEEMVVDPYYFWVDYYVDVLFKDGLMKYELHIKNVDKVFVGSVNLVSILEPLVSSDYD
ncbi:hypothetical protein V498_09066 [Pseudogymnoascus sp. VKM F-4517 (FW-2822)]|nr:hypothetical protein V498_09066 [Pseudogymnoascus sp. VKM F-4517 (FW-2822)]